MEQSVTIYQIVHTLGGEIRHLNAHLKILFEGYYHLFSGYVKLSEGDIAKQIKEVIKRSSCPSTVSLFVKIEISDSGAISISEHSRSLYRGYNIRCVTPQAALVEFAMPHCKWPTSLRSELTQFANREAKRTGGDVALRTWGGKVDLVNGAQIFALRDKELVTAAESLSVEHQLTINTANDLGLEITRRDIQASELSQFDELFYADHQGITAIKGCCGSYYMSITAAKIAHNLF